MFTEPTEEERAARNAAVMAGLARWEAKMEQRLKVMRWTSDIRRRRRKLHKTTSATFAGAVCASNPRAKKVM